MVLTPRREAASPQASPAWRPGPSGACGAWVTAPGPERAAAMPQEGASRRVHRLLNGANGSLTLAHRWPPASNPTNDKEVFHRHAQGNDDGTASAVKCGRNRRQVFQESPSSTQELCRSAATRSPCSSLRRRRAHDRSGKWPSKVPETAPGRASLVPAAPWNMPDQDPPPVVTPAKVPAEASMF